MTVAMPPRRGIKERNALVEKYRRLAYRLSRKFFSRSVVRRIGALADVEQEAIIALMRAAEIWDETRGVKFITYAYWAIARRLMDVGHQAGIIHVPHHRRLHEWDSIKATKVFYLDLNRPLRQEETDEIYSREECELLRRAIGCLDDRMRLILILRYGLNGDKPKTLSAVASRVNVTRQRVSQIQKQAEHILRVALSCCEDET